MTSFFAVKSKSKFLPRLMLSTTLAAAGFAAMTSSAQADNWGDHVADVGSITINTDTPNTTNIFQHDDFVKVRGDGDITADWTVNLNQPGRGSQYVLYDTESDPTFIRGKLNANGQVVIFDKQGTIFTDTSVVKVGSILVSTGHISDADLQNQKYNIVDADTGGRIVIDGSISVAEGGLAAFVAPTVTNNGVINAKMGKVAMASGDKVTLDLYGDNLVEIAVSDKVADGLIENNGTIDATGGTVYMGVETARQAVDTVINTKGIVKVSSVETRGGKIILSGGSKGTVKVSGELAANGTSGGSVKVTGQNVIVSDSALISADAGEHGNGGASYFYGTDYAIFSGRLSGRAGSLSGNGGNAEISGGESVGFDGLADLSADYGTAGTLLIDPRHLNLSSGSFAADWTFLTSGGADGTVTINDQALANTLRFSNVNLWATETLNTISNIDISTWKGLFGAKGITQNNLTVAAPTVNILHDVILGKGEFNIRDMYEGTSVLGFGIVTVPPPQILVETVNLNAGIFARSVVGGALTKAGDSQLNGDADTVNVKSDKAFIQQAIWLADAWGQALVNVANGQYKENLTIRNSLKLNGSNKAVLNGAGLGGTAINIRADDVVINNMTIRNYNDGIVNTKGSNITLTDNKISSIKDDGIYVHKNTGLVTITGNRIKDVGDEGIEVHGSESFGNKAIVINKNVIIGSGDDGIQVNYGSTSVEVKGNTVKNSRSDGIEIRNSNHVNVAKNTLTGNQDQAIDLQDSSDVRVFKNKIKDVIKNEGIYAYNIDGLRIIGNRIRNTEDDGIYVWGSYDVTIKDNNIRNIEGDGIHVEGVDTVDIIHNRIRNVEDDGIDVSYADSARILRNTITGTGDDGIVASDIGTRIISGKVSALAESVSEVPSYALTIRRNTITDAGQGWGGSSGGGSVDYRTTAKTVEKVADGDGIDVRNVVSTLIERNKIIDASDDGIIVAGDGFLSESRFFGPLMAMIRNNTVTGAGSDGIEVRNMTLSTIDINRVLRSGANGFLASGTNNGDVILTGNTFRRNPVGARFESGLIDLTGEANNFIGGKVGMQFDPATSWGIIGYEDESAPVFEDRIGEKIAFAIPIFGEIPASLNLVNNTIGTSKFTGQSKYYVELMNGALFDPDQPTVINGLNATYDEIEPFSTAGLLSDFDFDALEKKIQHYIDVKSLGLFIFGLTEAASASSTTADIAQQDIFLTVPGFDFGNGGINLTITGLPQIPGFTTPIANFLAGIAPAAGGTSAEALARIEPSAGGNTPATSQNTAASSSASCWGDALTQASQGGAVTMSYSESPDSALNNAASCQSGI